MNATGKLGAGFSAEPSRGPSQTHFTQVYIIQRSGSPGIHLPTCAKFLEDFLFLILWKHFTWRFFTTRTRTWIIRNSLLIFPQILERAHAAGITKMISIGTDLRKQRKGDCLGGTIRIHLRRRRMASDQCSGSARRHPRTAAQIGVAPESRRDRRDRSGLPPLAESEWRARSDAPSYDD